VPDRCIAIPAVIEQDGLAVDPRRGERRLQASRSATDDEDVCHVHE